MQRPLGTPMHQLLLFAVNFEPEPFLDHQSEQDRKNC